MPFTSFNRYDFKSPNPNHHVQHTHTHTHWVEQDLSHYIPRQTTMVVSSWSATGILTMEFHSATGFQIDTKREHLVSNRARLFLGKASHFRKADTKGKRVVLTKERRFKRMGNQPIDFFEAPLLCKVSVPHIASMQIFFREVSVLMEANLPGLPTKM